MALRCTYTVCATMIKEERKNSRVYSINGTRKCHLSDLPQEPIFQYHGHGIAVYKLIFDAINHISRGILYICTREAV